MPPITHSLPINSTTRLECVRSSTCSPGAVEVARDHEQAARAGVSGAALGGGRPR
jgi:hypothetical protein